LTFTKPPMHLNRNKTKKNKYNLMAIYSHSQLATFDQCPLKYKLQYLDKLDVDHPTTIEAFMGHVVHETLYKLYRDLQFEKRNALDEIIGYYKELWEKQYTDDILVVKGEYGPENYIMMGEKYVSDYYRHYAPFDDMRTVDLETQELIDLPDGNKYHVRIDRLGCVGNTYYVCDYKTNLKMKSQDEADADRQLAMYSIWVRDKFSDAERIVLKWHMLAFDKEIVSERSREQLDALVGETVRRIRDLERCSDFQPRVTNLCSYCVYRSYCPPFKHEADLAPKAIAEFKKDDGVQLVDNYAFLVSQKSEIDGRIKKLEGEIVAYAKQFGYTTVYGSNKKVAIREFQKVTLPEDKLAIVKLLQDKGLYDEYSHLNYSKLNSSILSGCIDRDIIRMAKIEPTYRLYLSSRITKG